MPGGMPGGMPGATPGAGSAGPTVEEAKIGILPDIASGIFLCDDTVTQGVAYLDVLMKFCWF